MKQFDSHRTPEEIAALIEELIGTHIEEELATGTPPRRLTQALELAPLIIGTVDGDVPEYSPQGTVLLSVPWETIENRMACVRAALAVGHSVATALASLPDLPRVH